MDNPLRWPKEETIRSRDVETFLAIHGERGKKVLSFLGRMQEFKAAVNTPVGNMMMTYLMERAEYLLDKITLLKASDSEKLEYSVITDLIKTIAKKIANFEKTKKKIKEDVADVR